MEGQNVGVRSACRATDVANCRNIRRDCLGEASDGMQSLSLPRGHELVEWLRERGTPTARRSCVRQFVHRSDVQVGVHSHLGTQIFRNVRTQQGRLGVTPCAQGNVQGRTCALRHHGITYCSADGLAGRQWTLGGRSPPYLLTPRKGWACAATVMACVWYHTHKTAQQHMVNQHGGIPCSDHRIFLIARVSSRAFLPQGLANLLQYTEVVTQGTERGGNAAGWSHGSPIVLCRRPP